MSSRPVRGVADFLNLGDWNAMCYVCGRKYKADTMVRHWQGYWVCPKDWEARHPQDFVRGIKDTQIPPWTQPLPTDSTFVTFCTVQTQTDITDSAVADCAIVDFVSPAYDPTVTS